MDSLFENFCHHPWPSSMNNCPRPGCNYVDMMAYDMVEIDPKRLRELGNISLKEDEYWKAISYYTKSLVKSPAGSRLRGLAYANRSAALLCIGLYEESIGDALTALQNDYPSELTHKLYLRMGMCKKAMGKQAEAEDDFHTALELVKKYYALKPGQEIQISAEIVKKAAEEQEPKLPRVQVEYQEPPPLRYGPHPEEPNFSAALTVTDEKVVAKMKFEVGDVLFVEDPLIFETNCVGADGETRWIYCYECLKMCLNLRPCPTCTWVCYCSEGCEKVAWEKYHKVECVAMEETMKELYKLNNGRVPPNYRCISISFKLLSAFGLENCINSVSVSNCKIRDDASALIKKFMHLAKRRVSIDCVDVADMIGLDVMADSLKLSGARKTKFMVFMKAAAAQALAHWRIVQDSSIAFTSEMEMTIGQQSVAYGIYPHSASIRNSCDPNVRANHFRKTMVLRVTRPIEEGEEVFQTIGVDYVRHGFWSRHDTWKSYSYVCRCAACVGRWPTFEDQKFCHKFVSEKPEFKVLYEKFKNNVVLSCNCCNSGYSASMFTQENTDICIKIHELYGTRRRDDLVYSHTMEFLENYYRFVTKRFVVDSNEESLQKPNWCIPLALKEE